MAWARAINLREGHQAAARLAFETSLELATSIDARELMMDSLLYLGEVAHMVAEYPTCEQYTQAALDVVADAPQPHLMARAYVQLGWCALCQGRYAESENYYRQCGAIHEYWKLIAPVSAWPATTHFAILFGDQSPANGGRPD